MQSDTYWSKRLQELDASLSKDEKQLFSELSKYYEQEYAALDKEIAAYYAKYGEENVIAFRTLLLELPDADKQLLLQNMDEFAKQYPEFAELLPVRESIYKLNRLEGLQTSSVLQQLKIGAIEQTKFREHFEKQVLKYANYAAEKLGFGTNFYRIDSEMLQVVIGNPWCNGKDFSERIWANREALAQTLQNEIANGLIRGEDYRTMSRILQQKFENTSQKQAERLVFTEDTYLSNEAKIRPFERNAAYTHYEYLCVEDHRTCETCRALSGQIFEISKRNAGLNFPPMHPWCRCTVMPVVEDLETIKRRLNADSGSGKSDAILLTDTRKDGIIKESMNRRNKNIGEFSELKIPMQKKAILNVCKKYNVETSGLRFKIQRDEKMLSMPFYGSTDYDDIGRIDLFPNAFTDEEQLIRTIIHEKCHVKQLKKHGKKYAQEHLQEMEKQAYRLESLYYHILKKRV
jgi:SPP1 gp7 family putative phage head morphogenesis protein